jgi:hypothetical protein
VVLPKSFGNVAMTPQLLAAASKLAASAAWHQRALSVSRDGSQVRALSHKLFGLRRRLSLPQAEVGWIAGRRSGLTWRDGVGRRLPQVARMRHSKIADGRPLSGANPDIKQTSPNDRV